MLMQHFLALLLGAGRPLGELISPHVPFELKTGQHSRCVFCILLKLCEKAYLCLVLLHVSFHTGIF